MSLSAGCSYKLEEVNRNIALGSSPYFSDLFSFCLEHRLLLLVNALTFLKFIFILFPVVSLCSELKTIFLFVFCYFPIAVCFCYLLKLFMRHACFFWSEIVWFGTGKKHSFLNWFFIFRLIMLFVFLLLWITCRVCFLKEFF